MTTNSDMMDALLNEAREVLKESPTGFSLTFQSLRDLVSIIEESARGERGRFAGALSERIQAAKRVKADG